jgi:NTE family protein
MRDSTDSSEQPANPPVPPGEIKTINLALQGGGSHGAFAWGVLDRLFESGRIDVEGIVGTSAGAMNAAVTAYGLTIGGPEGARAMLRKFWQTVSDKARQTMLQPSWLDGLVKPGSLDFSPGYLMLDMMTRMMSPYQLNPTNQNPLREALCEVIDFDILRKSERVKLYLCASNVITGRIRVFETGEMSPEAVLASACLPFLFQAVEIDGEHYWDGGYMGNPPIFPLIYNCISRDVLLVMINPIKINEVPKTAQAIFDRINTLSFNSSLMREMRAIHFVTGLIDRGFDDDGRLKRMYLHTIDAEDEMADLGVSSKLNASWDFMMRLSDLGRKYGDRFLAQHFDKIGCESSTDIPTRFL